MTFKSRFNSFGGYYRIVYYGEEHGITGKKIDIRFNISLKIINVNSRGPRTEP